MDQQSSNSSSALSKASIVDWVNSSVDPPQSYSCVKEIPAKVAAAFMNNIFGDSAFPSRHVNFAHDADRTDAAVARRNCDAVLEGASLLGFQPTFTGHSWANGVLDFGGVLIFWRWLRQKSLEKPLSRCLTAVEIGLVNDQNSTVENQLPPLLNNNNSSSQNRVVRLSDVASVAGISEQQQQQYNGPFMCGGPNGDIAKQLFDCNWKELQQMRKQHQELARAIAEGNLNRVVAALQAGHNMK